MLGGSADDADNRKAERFGDFMDKAAAAAPSDALRIILKQGGYENYLSRRSGSDAAPRSPAPKDRHAPRYSGKLRNAAGVYGQA